ncbi:MAG: translation elongation factor Ts [Phycisphaerae bacterium]
MGISAADVMKLRKMSGQGMMDCKKALAETNGDIEEAMTLLRKKGLATMAKRAERETTEGRVVVKTVGDVTVMVSLCCETDFVAKNDDFIAASEKLADVALNLAEGEKLEDVFAEDITVLVSKTGEKMEVGDWARLTADAGCVVGSYVHFNNKTGALVKIEGPASDALTQIANEICMHITATKPMALDQSSFDPEVIEKEKSIAAEQMRNEGKPEQIIENIVKGKINKMMADNCLVKQKFVKNEEITVEKAAQQAGATKIVDFARVTIG